MTLLLVVVTSWAAVGAFAATSRWLAGSWVTPFVVLAVPFQVAVTLAALLAEPMGFVAPLGAALLVLFAGLAAFGCGEVAVLAFLSPRPVASGMESQPWHGEEEWRWAVRGASWVVAGVMGLAFLRALRGVGALGEIVQEDFQTRYSSGPGGFARPLAMLLVVYWIGTVRRLRTLDVLTLAALFLPLFGSFVKGTLLLPLVGGLLYRVVAGRMRLSMWHVASGLVAAAGVFLAVYAVETAVWGIAGLAAPGFVSGLGRRLVSYLFSGVLGFSRAWEGGILPGPSDWGTLVAPAWNLGAHLGGYERAANMPASYLLVDLRVDPASGTSNVRTIVGQVVALAGSLGAAVAMLGLGLGFALLYATARRQRNAWLLVVSSLCGAALFFGWFDYYFSYNFWYIAVPVGLLSALCVRPSVHEPPVGDNAP